MSPVSVIIDTDPGVDDVLAILLALASPELRVLAIIVTYGNTDVDACYLNIIRMYDVLSKHLNEHPDDIKHWPNFSPEFKTILATGTSGPLEGELHSAQYFHGRDGLGDITNRYPEFNPTTSYTPGDNHPQLILTSKSGVDTALDLINSEPTKSISYLALGPLTTLAQVVRKRGALFKERIGKVICMGGALDVPGNTGPVAEFNFFADPYAVHDLLTPSPESYFPLDRFILLPLDITTPHELSFPSYTSLVDPSFCKPDQTSNESELLVRFTSAFLERTREVMVQFGKDAMELHDITVVWCAIDNPSLSGDDQSGWKFAKRKFQVERTGEITRGMLVVDRRDDQGAYAPGSNRSQVQAELEKHLDFHPQGVLESTALPAQVEVEDIAHAHPPALKEGRLYGEGVVVVRATPGPDVLFRLLTERVWGVGR